MMAAIIYTLCALTALAYAYLLLQDYRRGGYRLLLWSGLCFAGLTINNLLLVIDKLILPLDVVAALFFLRFWRQSRDSLFLWFSVAFGLDAATRLLLGLGHISDEHQPFFYLARLATFVVIIFAIVQKNWPRKLSK